jgi:hypothetical protein
MLNSGILAGQRPVWSDAGSQSQPIALTLSAFDLFPMTHHVEALPPSGENRPGLR